MQHVREKYKEISLPESGHVSSVRLFSQKRCLGRVGGQGVWLYLQTLLWIANFGRFYAIADLEFLQTRDHMWFPWLHLFNSNTDQSGFRVRSGLNLDCEGTDQFCGLSRPSGVSVWLLNLSWSHGLAKKKGLLGRMPLGRMSLRKQHTLLFMVFSSSHPPSNQILLSHTTEVKETKTCV